MSRRLRLSAAALGATAVIAALAGCASPFPKTLRAAVDPTVSFTGLRDAPDRYRGRTVMLGGIILSVKNTGEGTLLEVLQNDLDRSGRPRSSDETQGRFLVTTAEFLDAAVYKPGRLLTVIGDASGTRVQKLDAVDYAYPLVTAKALHLWRPRQLGPQCHIGIGVVKGF